MRLTAEHLQAIVELVGPIKYGRLTIEINETAQTIDIVTETRTRLPKDTDDTPRAGKVVRVGLKRDNPSMG